MISKTPTEVNAMTHDNDYELFIIGGGINGCGLARDAAGRGFKVGLAEMQDLASGTSSASTKLIHGGLRYLEQYAFRLVREALQEREVIWRIAPHIVRPLRFLLPYHKGLRPRWMLRAGLFIYDHLGGRKELPSSRSIDFHKEFGAPLKPEFVKGFEYSDEQVDDARLVILNARHAAELGADIRVRTEVRSVQGKKGKWHISLHDHVTGRNYEVTASYLANMAGPWINHVLHDAFHFRGHPPIRMVQGSHIVVPKLYEHDRAYIFQNSDNRIIFAIPYQEDFTLIGTTDRDYTGDPAQVKISEEETDYLLSAASEYFKNPLGRSMVVWAYSGVRPLYDDGASKAQVDYILKEMHQDDAPPLLNAYGGKITTYRRLAEDAMAFVEKKLGVRKPAWTGTIPLPGGDFPHTGLEQVEQAVARALPDLDAFTHRRLARSYGTEALKIYDHGRKERGRYFGHGLYEAEVAWLVEEEWAYSCDDILWRRSKLGLRFSKKERADLKAYLAGFHART